MKKITINTQTANYDVVIGDYTKNISNYITNKRCIFITDTNLLKLYPQLFNNVKVIAIAPGETNKNLDTVEHIYEQLLEKNVDRSHLVVGVGGGIVSDITGYVASTYMRGLNFGFISTSLLSQVDASVGGKNGINFNGVKNLIGTITQPGFVICDTKFLNTLPYEELLNGFAEVIKMALISDKDFFNFLNEHNSEALKLHQQTIEHIVETCIKHKAAIVETDEKDKGLRQILNFGHTVGHAIEKISGSKHGFAISEGMIFDAKLSLKLHKISNKQFSLISDIFEKYKLPVNSSVNKEDLKQTLLFDKKRESNYINIILLSDIGKAEIVKLKIKDIKEAIDDLY